MAVMAGMLTMTRMYECPKKISKRKRKQSTNLKEAYITKADLNKEALIESV